MTSALSKVVLNCKDNNAAHKTDNISKKRLIVRRGQSFQLTLHFSGQSFNANNLELTVQTGPEPSEDIGTKSVFGISGESQSMKPWLAKVKKTEATSVTLSISSHDFASIGKYTLSVKTHPDMTEGVSAGTFVLLFNPWLAEDWVYMANEDERQEYVMEDEGILYQGTSDYIGALAWDYGQFEEDILDICLKLLDLNPKCKENAAKDFAARCNPIYVGRVVSAMINSNGDRGVLQGNWGSTFTGGVSPSHWNGSVDILRRWRDSDYHPVKYGQCWVFGGVMCTVMRCLGIPSRTITNFQSAHDTHGNLLIDEYFTDSGYDPDASEDSIWNYHVWLESWMKRPDLPLPDLSYDGWQVLDPTPQELSEGAYCCGPAPVTAIKNGHTDLKYDLPFVFAEVNADWVGWKIMADGSKKKFHTNTSAVGRNISTKSVGSDERRNITASYKYLEGTDEERKAFKEAVKRTNKLTEPEPEPPSPPAEVSVEIKEKSKPMNGKDIELVMQLKCPNQRDLIFYISAQVMLYNSELESDIWNQEGELQLLANKELMFPFVIPFSKYGSHIQGNNSIKVTAFVADKENVFEFYMAERNIVPANPPFEISVIGNPEQYKVSEARINFANPLSMDLHDCKITVSGSGLLKQPVQTGIAFLPAGRQIFARLFFMPYKPKWKNLMATLECDQFQDIQSSCKIFVKPYVFN
ncbi:protein-glutamine gamma-glutamyltransferase 2-like [Conger conger]|uniref:protein-glutamine gamma-glutamyltransferase 2-like n=1 Tax=Conger conger TaxID=82655 RepID=UPI002A5A5ACA|nr:protein-glutamine gamma-glutamyltransferase 2-like [Conger conger]